jgi:hypothetical protein
MSGECGFRLFKRVAAFAGNIGRIVLLHDTSAVSIALMLLTIRPTLSVCKP